MYRFDNANLYGGHHIQKSPMKPKIIENLPFAYGFNSQHLGVDFGCLFFSLFEDNSQVFFGLIMLDCRHFGDDDGDWE